MPTVSVRIEVSNELYDLIDKAALLSCLGFEEWIIATCKDVAKQDIEFHKLPSCKVYVGGKGPDARWPVGASDED